MEWLPGNLEIGGRRLECDVCKAKTRKPHFFKLKAKGGSTGVHFSKGRKTCCPNCQRRKHKGMYNGCMPEDVQRIMQKHWQQASAFPNAPWNDMLQHLTDEDLIAMNRRCVDMNQRCVKEMRARESRKDTSDDVSGSLPSGFQAQTSRLPVTMEVSPVAPCPHSRPISGANACAAWKKCAACGKITEGTRQVGAWMDIPSGAWMEIS